MLVRFRDTLPITVVVILLAGPSPGSAQTSRFAVEVEVGPAWQTSNTVEIPNDGTATRFSLSQLAGDGPATAGRLYVTWHLTRKDDLRLLVAPFSLESAGVPSRPIDFAGASFATGLATEATYTFNSYRVTYRRLVHSGTRTTAWLGLTAKVRHASVRLEQGETRGRKDDLGFVPLLHLAADWRPANRWELSLDADALAGGPGRAIDASMKVGYELADRWSVRAGYRTIEGGADVDAVYNFAWLHYAVISLAYRP